MNERRPDPLGSAATAGRVVAGLFGLIFGGIGVTVIAFLWGSPWHEFGSPPLFFRVFGSFIALTFVVIGGATFFGALAAGNPISALGSRQDDAIGAAQDEQGGGSAASAPGYTCPQCSAPLSNKADVSPHGDVKCTYCNCWFNVYGK